MCVTRSQLLVLRTKVEKTWLNLHTFGDNFKNLIVKEARRVKERVDGTPRVAESMWRKKCEYLICIAQDRSSLECL